MVANRTRREILQKGGIGISAAAIPGIASANPSKEDTPRWNIDIEPQVPKSPEQEGERNKRKIGNEGNGTNGRKNTPRLAPDIVDHILITVTDTTRSDKSRFVGTIERDELKLAEIDDIAYQTFKRKDAGDVDVMSIPGRLPEAPDWVDKWDTYLYETGDWCWAEDGYEAGELNHLMTGATIDATMPLASVGGPALGAAIGTLFGSIIGPEGSVVGNYVGGMIGAVVGALLSAGWDTDTATFAFVDQDIGYWIEKAAIRAQFSGEYNDRAPNNMVPVGIYPGHHIIP